MEKFIYIAIIGVIFVVLWTIIRSLWDRFTQTVTIWDYQNALHFRNGELVGKLQAGKYRLWGEGHSVVVLDARITELVVQGQELITADCATLKLSAVVQWKIADAVKFHEAAVDPRQAIYTVVQLAMRELIGAVNLDEIVEKKCSFSNPLLQLVQNGTEDLGVEIVKADIRDVMLGGDLKSAYTNVLTAKKESLANLEKARGEAAALRTLANAARLFEKNPELMTLRYLDTLKETGTSGYGNTLVVGVPEELAGLVKKS